MKKKRNKVLRTCIVCRNRFEKQQLLRHVWRQDKAEVAVDHQQVMTGRGAYCCRRQHCLEQFAKRKKGLQKAFRL